MAKQELTKHEKNKKMLVRIFCGILALLMVGGSAYTLIAMLTM